MVAADADVRQEVLERMEIGAHIDTKDVAAISRRLAVANLTVPEAVAARDRKLVSAAARKQTNAAVAFFERQMCSFVDDVRKLPSYGSLSVFFNAVVAAKHTSITDRQFAAGLVYTGMFSARPKDDIGFAVGTTHVNSRVADGDAAEGLLRATSEYAFELYYTYRPTGGLLVRPNLQYVVDPGGVSENKNVFVLGLKTAATF